MSLRSSGFWCDVCNQPMVMEMALNKPIGHFKIRYFNETFHCHKQCRPALDHTVERQDYRLLPEGPVREALKQIEEHNASVAATAKERP